MDDRIARNAADLERELQWLAQLLDGRFKLYFGTEAPSPEPVPPDPPDLSRSDSEFARIVRDPDFGFAERVAVILALAPHVRPHLLDVFFTRNSTFDRRFTEFGGARGGPDGEFWPTGETLAFVIGGTDLVTRFSVQRMLAADAPLLRSGVLQLVRDGTQDTVLRARLHVADDCLARCTTGRVARPTFGAHFPAQYIETRLAWSDLVLHRATRKQLEEIETWIEHGHTLLHDWGMDKKLRPGLRALFYGPPGTGKTMTACLLGKSTGRDVYRIDLSLVVSKYIGETEKNLARVFDQAQDKGWILFFDEADALFGRRTETRDAHDRYANQEISFLLQRIETFDGIAILASNFRENLDEAFTRRFESIIYFPMPQADERLRLWQQGLPTNAVLDADLDLERLAREYVMSGGGIMNVVRHASLQSLKHGGRPIDMDDLVQGIRREHRKEGKLTS